MLVGAQWKVKSTLANTVNGKSSKWHDYRQVGKLFYNKPRLSNVQVEHVSGDLTDHYDSPSQVVLRLSDATDMELWLQPAVAAHECGHAVLDAENYFSARLRNAWCLRPKLGLAAAMPVIIAGLIFQMMALVHLGLFFSLVLVFQVVTLPVEFDGECTGASKILETKPTFGTRRNASCPQQLMQQRFNLCGGSRCHSPKLLRLIIPSSRNNDHVNPGGAYAPMKAHEKRETKQFQRLSR